MNEVSLPERKTRNSFVRREEQTHGVAEENFGFRFVGSEGVMSTGDSSVKLAKEPRESEPGFTTEKFPKAMQHKDAGRVPRQVSAQAANGGVHRYAG